MRTTTPTKLNFTEFSNDVTTNQIKTATINTTGAVSGNLTNGTSYTSQIPTALQDSTLAATLQQHNVQITGSAPSSGITIGAVILDLLPLALFIGFFVWLGRRSQKALGGIGGVMGVGRSKAKCMTRTVRAPGSRTSPATKGPRRRCRRWWTSSRTPIATSGPEQWVPRVC